MVSFIIRLQGRPVLIPCYILITIFMSHLFSHHRHALQVPGGSNKKVACQGTNDPMGAPLSFPGEVTFRSPRSGADKGWLLLIAHKALLFATGQSGRMVMTIMRSRQPATAVNIPCGSITHSQTFLHHVSSHSTPFLRSS